MQYSVVLFYSMTQALQAEKLLKDRGLAVKLVPVPRQVDSDCGVCLRIRTEDEAAAGRALDEARIDSKGVRAL